MLRHITAGLLSLRGFVLGTLPFCVLQPLTDGRLLRRYPFCVLLGLFQFLAASAVVDNAVDHAVVDLLLEMKKVKDKAIEKGKDFLSYYHYHKFDKKYDELIEQARKENPLPETTEKKRDQKKKGKILALVEHLANYKVSVCLFIHNFNVPFDINQAERDLRMIKVKTKVSGCFRTEKGARDYLKIMSYVGTAHKQGHNAYQAIKNAISGHPDFIFE